MPRDERSRSPDRREKRRRSRSRERKSRRGSRSISREKTGSTVTPLHLWERKMTFWDIAPPGYEGMTVEQVKQTGHFPAPGTVAKPFGNYAASVVYANPDILPKVLPPGDPALAAGAAQPATIARQARRLYVGSIPFGITEEPLMAFFNQTVVSMGICKPEPTPVIAVQINHEKNYAFVEFVTPEDATAAMSLDGLQFQGQILKIRRPKDYQPPTGASVSSQVLSGVVSTQVLDSPYKLFVGGLPPYLNDEQVMELLKSFGDLKAFNLVKDTATGLSKGFAFCEYLNPAITDIACQGLNGMELGDKKLIVQRASIGANKPVAPISLGPSLLATSFIGATAADSDPTTVLLLLNMVTEEELVDDEEYNDIMEDIKDECSKFGAVKEVLIPRPVEGGENTHVGKIFVEFDEIESATTALKALAGRKFADRTVFTSYVDAETYEKVRGSL